MNLYTLFTYSGILYALHGIVYSILTLAYDKYDLSHKSNIDTFNLSYLVFRCVTSMMIFGGGLFLNAIRYDTRFKSAYASLLIGNRYSQFQKACFTAVGFMLCVQYVYHAYTFVHVDTTASFDMIDTMRFYIDIAGSLWLWYSLFYRIFVDDDIMVIRGNYTKTNTHATTQNTTYSKQREPIN